MDESNDQRQQRIKKLDQLRQLGVAPYGTRFEVKDRAGQLVRLHGEKTKDTLEQEQIGCTIAGRIVGLRRFGKAAFAVLQDGSERLQVYLKKDTLGEQTHQISEGLDLGDWIGVTGTLFRTKTNEFTVEAKTLTFLSKALRPLPEKWHGLPDVETRYRQRYVDLIANPQVHQIFALRSRIVSGIRAFLNERGFLEVETPMLSAAGAPVDESGIAERCRAAPRSVTTAADSAGPTALIAVSSRSPVPVAVYEYSLTWPSSLPVVCGVVSATAVGVATCLTVAK